MKNIKCLFLPKPMGLSLFWVLLLCLCFQVPAFAQLSPAQQTKVNQATQNTTQQIPLLQPFLDNMQLGAPAVITDSESTFKFKRERLNVPFSTVLADLAATINDPAVNALMNNPVLTGLNSVFGSNSLVAEFTINNLNSNPTYTVSLLGTSVGLNFEFYLGRGTGSTDFVLAIAPENMTFGQIHTGLSTFDEFANPSVGIFLTKPGAEISPDMAILGSMGMQGLTLSNPLTAVANIQVRPDSDPGRLFKVNNMIAKAEIPGTITDPLVLTATLETDWDFGPDASISEVSLVFSAGMSEGSPELSQTASFTLNTNLPSDLTGQTKSAVSWVFEVEISGGPDETGVAARVGGYAAMSGTWATPFGFNELSLNSLGGELGLTITVSPPVPPSAVPVVTVLPDLGLRGDVNVGRTQALRLSMGGKLDFADFYASGIYGEFENIGLGTVMSELYLDQIGGGVSAAQLRMLDTVFVERAKLRLFPVGASIAGEDFDPGILLDGRAKAFGVVSNARFLFDPNGISGDLMISPINYAPNNIDVFSLSGVTPGDSLRASINLQFNSIAAQLSSAFNGTPFMMADARIGLLGATANTKLIFNPIHGSYFSANMALLDVLDVKMEGEMKSLSKFGDMKIRAAMDKAPAEILTNALRQHFETTVRGLFSMERAAEIEEILPLKLTELGNLRSQIQEERNANIATYNQARDNLESTLQEFHRLDNLAKQVWAQHEALPWGHWDRIGLWLETTRLNTERDFVFVGVRIAQAAFDLLAWVNTIPPVELDPRITALKYEITGLEFEQSLIIKTNEMAPGISATMKDLHQSFLNSGIYTLADVKQAEFQGDLGVMWGGEFDMMINMIFMNEEISLTSKVGIKNDGTFDISTLVDDLLNGRYTPAFSSTFAGEIGTKYNYSTNYATVNPISAPQNGTYTPLANIPPSNLVGQPGNVSGLDAYAAAFNGTSDYEEKSGNWGNGWTEMTIEAWVKSNGSNGDFQTIVSGNEGFVHFQMTSNADGNNAVYLSNGFVILLPTLPDATTEWRHVAIVVKSGDSKVYQNGEMIGQANYLGFGDGTIVPTNHIRLGSNSQYGRYLNGKLADVRIWNVARTRAEIQAGMHNAPAPGTTGLVGAYHRQFASPEMAAQLDARAQVFTAYSDISAMGNFTQDLTAMTIEAWVKNEGGGENIQAIVSSEELNFAHLQSSEDPYAHCAVYVNNGEVHLPAVPKSIGQWQHIVMVVQSGNSQLYINGEPYGPVDNKTFSSINPATAVLIGKGFQRTRAFAGKIADVRIWNVAKTPADLFANAQGFNPNNDSQIVYFSPYSNPLVINSANNCREVPGFVTNDLQSMTIEAWINNDNVQNDIQAIVSATGPEFVHFQVSGNGSVSNAVYLSDGNSIMLPVIPALSPGWHHVAIVVASGNNSVYVDGQQVGNTNTTTFTGIKSSESVFIGKGWAGGRLFNGKIADVRFWRNQALTQAQIQANQYTPPINSAQWGLVYHYK